MSLLNTDGRPGALGIPQIHDNGVSKQLIVHGKPFLLLGAQLQNSSLTSAEYMEPIWQDLADAHINTVLGGVTWELIEPVEDEFDFSGLDAVLQGAREHGLHLVLLWFASFKNGKSTYVPSWVKTDPGRFPRAKLRRAGGILEPTEVLSLFHPEAPRADAKAFAKLMEHLKEVDGVYSTVLMVQVENEPGLLGDSRDANDAAEKAFAAPVPGPVLQFLTDDWDELREDFNGRMSGPWESSRGTGSGPWEVVFGKGPRTDELFMAYHYALYLDQVAAAGKAVYPLPMYTNVWQNYAEGAVTAAGGSQPGDYPSGGATSNVLDIWQRFAPSLDFISPDIYLNDYDKTCAKYSHRAQPFFVPEQRRDQYGARRVWIAFGSYAAIGTSPFGIDTLTPVSKSPIAKHYALLDSVSSIVLEAQKRPDSSVGFCFDERPAKSESSKATDTGTVGPGNAPIVRRWGGYEITIERCFVFGHPGPAAGMVIHLGSASFLLIGWGFQVRGRSLDPNSTFTGILRYEEKMVGQSGHGSGLRTSRRLNGDETRSGACAMMPGESPDYGGFPICVTIPARTMIAELEFYSLAESGS